MEKLIKLLDEYDHKKTEDLERGKQRVDNQKLWIISKQFGFIERLVKKGKVDKKKIRCPIIHYKIEEDREGGIHYCDLDFANEIDSLLMQLSISDNPIDDLILYLNQL